MSDSFKEKAIITLLSSCGYDIVDTFFFYNEHFKSDVFILKFKFKGHFLYTRIPFVSNIKEQIDYICEVIIDKIREASLEVLDEEDYFDFIATQLIERQFIDNKKQIKLNYDELEETVHYIFEKYKNPLDILNYVEVVNFTNIIND